MCCKIERLATAAGTVVFRLCGRIGSEQVQIIRELIAREDDQIELNLSEITLIDREAVTYLASCELSGIGLTNCPLFVREWIAQSRRA